MVDVYGRCSRSTALSISDNTLTKVTGLSADKLVPSGAPALWDNTDQRYEVATGWGGEYAATARVEWDVNQYGPRLVEVRVNGSTRHVLSQCDAGWSATCSTGLVHGGTAHLTLADGDYVELRVRQVSGASKNLAAVHEFTIHRIGD